MAPFTAEVAAELIEEFADLKVLHGFRGRPGWDLDALARTLVAAGQLAARGREWIATLDINPLIYGPDGFHAVDALLLLRESRAEGMSRPATAASASPAAMIANPAV
jgi:hypothetical protein